MTHGSYNSCTTLSYPMGHGLYIRIDPFITHGGWRMSYPWVMDCTMYFIVTFFPWPMVSWTEDIVTKINILLQEICDIKLQKQRNNIFNVHKIRPKSTGGENAQDDTHLFYNSASFHLLPDKQNTPEHHALNSNHAPNIGDSCQDMMFLNFYFDQFHAHSINISPFASQTFLLWSLRIHDLWTEQVYWLEHANMM